MYLEYYLCIFYFLACGFFKVLCEAVGKTVQEGHFKSQSPHLQPTEVHDFSLVCVEWAQAGNKQFS